MKEEKINSAKEFLKSLEENLNNLKEAMKAGDEEKFNELKKNSNEVIKEMGELFSEEEKSDEQKKPKKKGAK